MLQTHHGGLPFAQRSEKTGDIGSLVKAEKGHLLKLHEQIEVALGDGAVGGQDAVADDTAA